MSRLSFTVWRLPPDFDGILLREDRARSGAQFTPAQRHSHDELELHFIERGTCSILLRSRRVDMRAGTLLWVPPGRDHLHLSGSRDLVRWLLLLRSRAVGRVLPAPAVMAHVGSKAEERIAHLSPGSGALLKRLFEEVRAHLGWWSSRGDAAATPEQVAHQRDADVCLLNAGFAYALARCYQMSLSAEAAPDPAAFHPAIQRALALLREQVPPPPLASLARACRISPAHLSKQFSAQVGMSITEFRNRIRLERFLRLYGDGREMKMSAAALDAGFGSYPQFHRVFRSFMGCAPAAYRPPSTRQPAP